MRRVLQKLGLDRYFSSIVTSTDLGVSKPHPDMFLWALSLLGVAPQQAVMVGNDARRDIRGAKALGLMTILFRQSNYYRVGDECDAVYCIDSLDELPSIIDTITRKQL